MSLNVIKSNEIKLKELNCYLGTLIGEYGMSIADSLRKMENFNISKKEYREETLSINVASFSLTYLNRVKKMAEETDYDTTENFIRFHKHQLETKASDFEDNPIKIAQSSTISALSTIIALYLDK